MVGSFVVDKKGKFYFPNLKMFLKGHGITFTNFVKEANNYQKFSKPLSERTWHNASSEKIGVSELSINGMVNCIKSIFNEMQIEYSGDVIEVKSTSLQQELFND